MSKRPVFITGNQHKADYLSQLLGIELVHHKVDVDEIQSPDPQIVIEHKVRQAYELLNQPVLVEDTSLVFNALGTLPGTFIKFFVDAENGLENLCRMLDGFNDRSAYASAVYGYYDGVEVRFFSGRLEGNIAIHPKGDGGFGWDQIFEPHGYGGRSRAELSQQEDTLTYLAIRDLDRLRDFLQA